MFENVVQTRIAICGAGILLAIIFLVSHLPLILLLAPVTILFLGIVADPEETHAVWYGMLHTIGIFELTALAEEEQRNYLQKKHYFWFGEIASAVVLALVFSIPLGLFLAQRTDITLAFIGATLLFLPLFVFLPRAIQQGMKADTAAILETLGKNELVKKVFWTVFAAIAGLVLVRVVDPVTAQQMVGMIAGMGW
ncbi:MAG: hypothetical protein Q7U51_05120 [Methanoregula sp.]|nr:hypothetical protein [Methanoregula sp.]